MASADIQESITRGMQCLRAGQVAEAERLLRGVLSADPVPVEVLGALGQIAFMTGRVDEAAVMLRRAVALKPDAFELRGNLGMVLSALQQFDEAIEQFNAALKFRTDLPDVWNNLGVALEARDRLDDAIVAFERAAELRPGNARTWINLGTARLKKEMFAKSAEAYRRAIDCDDTDVDARIGLRSALHRMGDFAAAIGEYREVLSRLPGRADAHNRLGHSMQAAGEFENAVECYRIALQTTEDGDTAFQLGICLQELGRWEEAIASYEQAAALSPDRSDIKLNLGIALLTVGRLREGWDMYRFRGDVRKIVNADPVSGPEWQGEALDGKRILLHAEQGFGDTLQLARYVPMVRERGGRVIVLCPRSLHRVISTVEGIEAVVGGGDAMPAFDVQTSLMNLPRVFATSLETIPNQVPYLFATDAIKEKWREQVEQQAGAFKVGLCWAGNPEHQNDRNRSIKPEELKPLAACRDVTFFNLQKGPAGKQAPAGIRLIDWTEELTDFGETAGLIANLDLVISVDTAVVHLCGAMGLPVWVMLPEPADWRWMREREDSPWYPTARLFRNVQANGWRDCVSRVAMELDKMTVP